MASKRYNWKIGDIIRRRDLDDICHCLVLDYVYNKYYESYTVHILETNETINICPETSVRGVWRKVA